MCSDCKHPAGAGRERWEVPAPPWGGLMAAGTLLAPQLPPPRMGLQPSPEPRASSLLPHPRPGCRRSSGAARAVSTSHPAWDRGLEPQGGVRPQHPRRGGPRGQPEDGGEPNALFSSLSMPGNFSHWMAALEQRNIPGRGDLHWRDFSPWFSGSRDVCAWAEDVRVQHTLVCTVPTTDA